MTMNRPDPPASVVVLASGGLDSTTLAYRLRDMGPRPGYFHLTTGSGTHGSWSAPGR